MDTMRSTSPQFVAKSTPTAARPQADQRPSADSLALNKKVAPDIPFPIPSTLAPLAHATKAQLNKQSQGPNHTKAGTNRVEQSQRVLKPFGITMLPYEEQAKSVADQQRDGSASRMKET